MARFFSIKNSLAVVSAAVLLAACGSGSSSYTEIKTTEDAAVAINPTTGNITAAAIDGATFSFATGIPALGTTSATALTVEKPAAGSPTFAIASGAETAEGVLGFGSCIFTVTSVSNPGGPLDLALASKDEDGVPGLNYKITVAQCAVKFEATGQTADSTAFAPSTAVFDIGGATSAEATLEPGVTLSISPNGSVSMTVDGQTQEVGTVDTETVVVTGATGG